jgi:hypothetical protein
VKFQKGLLDDLVERPPEPEKKKPRPAVAGSAPPIDNDHLFETHQRTTRSWQQYLKLLGIVSVLVVLAGGAIFYLTLPSFGDRVRAPQGLEPAMRSYFLDTEKRTANDIAFYFCDTYYWARVEVEKRPDITTNPVYQIGTYVARATADGDEWKISAVPVTTPEIDVPCR